MNTRRLPLSSLFLLAAFLGAAAFQVAHAQPVRFNAAGQPLDAAQPMRPGFMPGRFQHLLEPDYRLRDAALLHQELHLHRAQRPIIELLLEDYRAAFDEAAQRLRDAAARAPRPTGVFPLPMGERVVHAIDQPVIIPLEGASITVRGNVSIREIGDGARPSVVVLRGEDGAVSVDVSFGDDEEVSESARQRAEEIARTINERMERRRAIIEEQRREAAERAAEQPEPLDPQEVISIAREFLAQKELLRDRFEQDVQSVLNDDQLEQWPQATALVRRVNRLQQGRLSGEQVDLSTVVRDLHFPQFLEQRIEPHLDQYLMELDAALEARSIALDRADIDLFEALHAQDFERMLAIDERVGARRIAVRDANDRHALHIAAAIEHEEWREKFAAEVRGRAYPWTLRPTPFNHMVSDALGHEDLTEEQREAVEDLLSRYEAEVALADERTIQEIRETEHLRTRRFIEMMQQWHSGEAPGRGIRGMMDQSQMRQQRMSVAMRYIRELRGLLPGDMLPESRPVFWTDYPFVP